MKKILLFISALISIQLSAQTLLPGGIAEIVENKVELAGCNYASYFNVYRYLLQQGETQMTPSPEGYEPFYISTYMRHGSRWLTQAKTYDEPIQTLKNAAAKGNLTEEGTTLLDEMKQLRKACPNEKFGVLTRIGAAQHRGIAKRMCARFPEIFNSTGSFFAQSSTSKRCIKSMNNECEIIDSITHAPIIQVSGKKGMQDRLAGIYTNKKYDDIRSKGFPLHSKDYNELTPYKRICETLFRNPSAMTVNAQQAFVRGLYDVAINMQSHDLDIDLMRYFNNEEVCALWTIKNRHWYRMFGPSPVTQGLMPLRSKWQLEDILEGADSVVNRREWHGTNLRFGHDTSLMPLACLLELGTCNKAVPEEEIGTIDTFWRNQEIFPMAGNIQLVFYRPINGEGDILIKALLNEREVTLPGTPAIGPYYYWNEISNYWKEKIRNK